MDIDAYAGFPERGGDDCVALRVHMQLAVLVNRNNRRVAGRILKVRLHIIGQCVVLRVGGHMQGMVAANNAIEIVFLTGQNRCAGEGHKDFIDIFGRGTGCGLLRAGLPEKEVKPVSCRKPAFVYIAFKVKAGCVPLGIVLKRQHRFDLIGADP